MTEFEFEEEEYVCDSCGGENWHANVFFLNCKKRWVADRDCDFWCADCDGPTGITPFAEYEDEIEKHESH